MAFNSSVPKYLSLATIFSLNMYAPVSGDFIIFIHKVSVLPAPIFKVATTFFAIIQNFYLISLCTVTFFNIGLYFLISRRSGVFFLFLVVIYLEVPGRPLSLCSVHSNITCTLFPFFAIL